MAQDSSRLDRRALWGLLILVFLITLLPRVIGNDHALSSDEPYFFNWTNQFYTAVMHGDLRGTLVGYGYPATTIFWIDSVTIGVQHASHLIKQGQPATWSALAEMTDAFALTLSNLLIRRLPIIALDAAVVGLVFFLLTRLVDWRLALLSTMFIALDPFYLTQARVLRTQVLAVTFMLGGVLSMAVLLMGRGGRRYLWLAGMLTGLAVATRVSSLFGLAMMGLMGTVPFFITRRSEPWPARLRWAGGVGLTVAFSAVLVFWILWPVMWVDPLAALRLSGGFVSGLIGDPRTTYFLGAIRERDPIMLLYYPLLFALKLTPTVTIGLALVVGEAIWQAVGYWRLRRQTNLVDFVRGISGSHELLLGAAMLAYTLLYLVQMTRSGHKYDHSITPAFPAAAVAAAVGLWRLLRNLLGQGRWSLAGVRLGSVVLLIAVQAAFVLPYHPNYGGHINALLGGPPTAPKLIEVQAGEEVAAHYLNSLPPAESKTAAVRTVRRFEPIFRGKTIHLSNAPEWAQADYLVIGIYHLLRQIHDPQFLGYVQRQEPLYTVKLGGLEYMWVYPGPQFGEYVGQQVEGKATLLRFENATTTVATGEEVPVRLLWRNEGLADGDDVHVTLVDPGGNIWARVVATPDEPFADAARQKGGIVESTVQLGVPVGTPPGEYSLRVGLSNRYRDITPVYFDLPADSQRLTVVRSTLWPAVEDIDVGHRVETPAAGNLWLVGYDLPDDRLVLGSDNVLTLTWQAGDRLPDYAMALQLRDAAGEEIAFWLGRPVRSSYPTDQWQPGEIVRDPWDLFLAADVVPGAYHLTLTLFEVEEEREVSRLRLGGVTVDEYRRQFEVPPMQVLSGARFDDRITLLGYNLSVVPLADGGQIEVLLYWRADQPAATDYAVFVHLVVQDDFVVAQHEGVPGQGERPTISWEPGEVIADKRSLYFGTLPAGDYRLIIGIRDPATGQRLPVVAQDGTLLGDSLVLEIFQIGLEDK